MNEETPKMQISSLSLNGKRSWACSSEYLEFENCTISRTKFFEFNEEKMQFEINTVEIDPHSSKTVGSEGFQTFNFEDKFLTLGQDGSVIEWGLASKSSEDGEVMLLYLILDLGGTE